MDETTVRILLPSMGRITPERAKELISSPRIEWHDGEINRHGVVRGIGRNDVAEWTAAIDYYLGDRSCWRRTTAGLTDLEFVAMTKVFPPPTKPWEWCGVTVLFGDWAEQESRARTAAIQARASFPPGSRVAFDAKGRTHYGLVTSVNTKSLTITVEGSGAWRVSPALVRHA